MTKTNKYKARVVDPEHPGVLEDADYFSHGTSHKEDLIAVKKAVEAKE